MIFLFSLWTYKLHLGKTKINSEINQLNKRLELLREKNKELKNKTENINNEKYIEEKAREQGFQKPDEESIIINKKNE